MGVSMRRIWRICTDKGGPSLEGVGHPFFSAHKKKEPPLGKGDSRPGRTLLL
jgi:hypothetical protein